MLFVITLPEGNTRYSSRESKDKIVSHTLFASEKIPKLGCNTSQRIEI